jgi:hypothetical protein
MTSSLIEDYVYDAEKAVLTITLTSGRIYAYEDVPPQVYEAFRFASSKGRYYNEYVRDRFRPTELTERPEKPSAQVLPFRKKGDQ